MRLISPLDDVYAVRAAGDLECGDGNFAVVEDIYADPGVRPHHDTGRVDF